jgi:hypothetical protein
VSSQNRSGSLRRTGWATSQVERCQVVAGFGLLLGRKRLTFVDAAETVVVQAPDDLVLPRRLEQ